MDLGSILTLLTLIEERAKVARILLAQAILHDQEARQPRLVLNGATNAPTASQAAQKAHQARQAANQMIGELLNFASALQKNGTTDAQTVPENPEAPAHN